MGGAVQAGLINDQLVGGLVTAQSDIELTTVQGVIALSPEGSGFVAAAVCVRVALHGSGSALRCVAGVFSAYPLSVSPFAGGRRQGARLVWMAAVGKARGGPDYLS